MSLISIIAFVYVLTAVLHTGYDPSTVLYGPGRGIAQQHMLGEALGNIYGERLEMVRRRTTLLARGVGGRA